MPALAVIDRTVTEVAARLTGKDLQVLAAVAAGIVRSDHDTASSAIRSHGDLIQPVTTVMRSLETAGLAERAGRDWCGAS